MFLFYRGYNRTSGWEARVTVFENAGQSYLPVCGRVIFNC